METRYEGNANLILTNPSQDKPSRLLTKKMVGLFCSRVFSRSKAFLPAAVHSYVFFSVPELLQKNLPVPGFEPTQSNPKEAHHHYTIEASECKY